MDKMSKVKTGDKEWDVPPLRSLNDFILESARFQMPNIKDLEKWNNRVVNNLLYYQTNYFIMSFIIFLIVGLIHPTQMLVGMLAMIVILGVFVYVSTEGSTIYHIKKQYPWAGILFIILAGSFVTYTMGSLIVFLLGTLLPFCATFVHASMRSRNIKNKVVNTIESIGLRRTPMGILLGYLEDVTGMTIRAQTSLIKSPHY